jgi:hypothetical protein
MLKQNFKLSVWLKFEDLNSVPVPAATIVSSSSRDPVYWKPGVVLDLTQPEQKKALNEVNAQLQGGAKPPKRKRKLELYSAKESILRPLRRTSYMTKCHVPEIFQEAKKKQKGRNHEMYSKSTKLNCTICCQACEADLIKPA